MVLKPRAIPSRIREIIAMQQRQLMAMQPRYQKRLLKLAREAERTLRDELRRVAPTTWTAQHTRVVLAQVRGVVDALGAIYGAEEAAIMSAMARGAAEVGREHLLQQIDYWGADERFRDSVRAVARVDVAGELLTPGLLELHSRERYGDIKIRRMHDVLARSTLAGETVIQTANALADSMRMAPYRAERIVRTEATRAMHVRQMADMETMFGEDFEEEWLKELVETFDDRTGRDSYPAHGQTRRIREEFQDGAGRRYQLPPGRPNDRGVVVYVPRDAPVERPESNRPA